MKNNASNQERLLLNYIKEINSLEVPNSLKPINELKFHVDYFTVWVDFKAILVMSCNYFKVTEQMHHELLKGKQIYIKLERQCKPCSNWSFLNKELTQRGITPDPRNDGLTRTFLYSENNFNFFKNLIDIQQKALRIINQDDESELAQDLLFATCDLYYKIISTRP